jgi:C-terminal processing protease CtpA/Prc
VVGEHLDALGRVREKRYVNLDGKPALRTDGYSTWKGAYDARGNLIGMGYYESHLDENKKTIDKLVANSDGFAIRKDTFDDRGNRTVEEFYDPNVKPTLHKNCYHKLVATFDRLGQTTSITAFDTAGKPLRLEVFVTEVVPGGPSERLGIQVGDVLRTYDGKEVHDQAAFLYQRRLDNDPSAMKKLTIERSGKMLEFSIAPGILGIRMDSRVH